MTLAQWAIGYIFTALSACLLAILLWRRHSSVMPVFTLYLGWITTYHVLIAVSPSRFYTADLWLVHKVAEATLRFGVALELAHRIFRGFPGAASTAMNALLAIATLGALATASIYSPQASYVEVVTVVVPRAAHATAWMLTALAMLVLWYRIPLGSLQRAILMGLMPYLLVFSAGMALLQGERWHELRDIVGYITTIAYGCLLAYWSIVAWTTRPVEALFVVSLPPPSDTRSTA